MTTTRFYRGSRVSPRSRWRLLDVAVLAVVLAVLAVILTRCSSPAWAGGLPPCEPVAAAPCPTCPACETCPDTSPPQIEYRRVRCPECPPCPDPCPPPIVQLPPVEAAPAPGWLLGVGAGTNLARGYMGEVELLAPSRRWSIFTALVHTEDDTLLHRTIDSHYGDDEGDDTPVQFRVTDAISYETDTVFAGAKWWFGRR